MSAIYVLIPISLVVALAFLAGFIWAVKSGQYDDTCTPSMRVLAEDPILKPSPHRTPSPTGIPAKQLPDSHISFQSSPSTTRQSDRKE